MTMNQQMRLFIAGLFMLNVSACSLPLKVDRVDSMNTEVKGVRYMLKRPTYMAGLRIDLKETQFVVDQEQINKINGIKKFQDGLAIHSMENLSDKSWATASDMNNPQERYCLKIDGIKVPLIITLQQKMDEDFIIYEATSRNTPPHWFADSESSITMDDDGYLTAIMAGENDKSLEFIQAVAGLAVSALTPADSKQVSCLLIEDEKFHKYVTEHIQLASLKTNLPDKLNKTLKNIEPNSPDMKGQLESISLLRAEIARVDESLKKVQYDMPAGTFLVEELKIGKEKDPIPLVKGKEGKKPWFTLQLTSQ